MMMVYINYHHAEATIIIICKECHKTDSLGNRTATHHKEEVQLKDRTSVGASSCNLGAGKDQRVQSLMFMMMMMMIICALVLQLKDVILSTCKVQVRRNYLYYRNMVISYGTLKVGKLNSNYGILL